MKAVVMERFSPANQVFIEQLNGVRLQCLSHPVPR